MVLKLTQETKNRNTASPNPNAQLPSARACQ